MRLVIDAEYLARHNACETWREAVAPVLPITLTGEVEVDRAEAQRVIADETVWGEVLLSRDYRVDCRCEHCNLARVEGKPTADHVELLPVGWLIQAVQRDYLAATGEFPPAWPRDRKISSLSAWIAALPDERAELG